MTRHRKQIFRYGVVAGIVALAFGAAAAGFSEPLTLDAPLDSRNAPKAESTLGDLVADAILAAAPGADFALSPAAEIKADRIDAGKTTTERVAGALRGQNDPDDTVATMRLTGAQVRAALAHGVSRAPSPYDGFLQVAGLTVHYDLTKRGAARVAEVTVTRTGETLQPDKTYTVAMPDMLADGALGFFDIWSKAPAPVDMKTTVSAAVARYAAAHQPVGYKVEGRISGV